MAKEDKPAGAPPAKTPSEAGSAAPPKPKGPPLIDVKGGQVPERPTIPERPLVPQRPTGPRRPTGPPDRAAPERPNPPKDRNR